MPASTDPVQTARKASEAARAALARRDDAICAAVASGASLRAVAVAAGLTHAGVAKIVARRT